MGNVKDIRFFRSQQVYASLSEAKTAVLAQKNNLGDGSPIVARYYEGNTIFSLIGIVHSDLSGSTDISFFTTANYLADVITKLNTLSGKTFTDLKSPNNSISIITAVTEDGTIGVSASTDASKISGLTAVANSDEGAAKVSGVSTTDTVQTGIKNLYDSLKSEIAARKNAMLARKISGDSAIEVTETPNADGFGTSIKLRLDGTTQGNGTEKTGVDNALTVTENGLFLSSLWECGTFE